MHKCSIMHNITYDIFYVSSEMSIPNRFSFISLNTVDIKYHHLSKVAQVVWQYILDRQVKLKVEFWPGDRRFFVTTCPDTATVSSAICRRRLLWARRANYRDFNRTTVNAFMRRLSKNVVQQKFPAAAKSDHACKLRSRTGQTKDQFGSELRSKQTPTAKIGRTV